jgi:hypothetical protein
MRWYYPILVLAVAGLTTARAPAISLFSKRAKVNPAERVPELIKTARTAPEERRRAGAVEELRQYDAVAFPQIVPTLAEVLKVDPSTAVRAEAAHSLGRLRPASVAAVQALETASKDTAKRVRFQARAALLFYPSSVARAAHASPTAVPQPAAAIAPEPPVAAGPMVPANPHLLPVPSAVTTAPPEVAPGLPAQPTPVTPTGIARPLPRGPNQSPGPPPQGDPEPLVVPDPAQGPLVPPG